MLIRHAEPHDLAGVTALLRSVDLPTVGVDDQVNFVVAQEDGTIVGCAGLEPHGAGALLRSVAVHPEYRNHGIGRTLVTRVLDHALQSGVRTVYLLTTTAAEYFQKMGFEEIPQEYVDTMVQQSPEFTAACCDAATAMRLILDDSRKS